MGDGGAAAVREQAGAFLGVARSATGRRWAGPGPEAARRTEALVQAEGLAAPVAAVLARLGVPPDGARAFLAPALRDLMPDPSTLRDMDRAADILLAALAGGKRIAVFADYDADGAAAAALLLRWLRAMGQAATLYVPDRIAEGYGPNAAAMAALARDHGLILCVDCGSAAPGPVAAARALGAEVVILDHHLAGEALPEASALVNPNLPGDRSGLGHLSAAGLVFLFLVAANRAARGRGLAVPDLLPLLDLVALSTVADVVPLRGLNRAYVRQGLRVMAGGLRPGLAALAAAAGMQGAPGAHQLGFVLGPRINAGGRVGGADLAARLLATDDAAEAARLAARLEALNRERRALEAVALDAALADAAARDRGGPLVWAAGDWHPGVVGIVAARLREAFDRPAVVVALEGAEGRASGRSVPGVDLGAAAARLAAEGLALRAGGHPMAAGLTLARDRIEAAMDRLAALLLLQGARPAGPGTLSLDGLLAPAAVTPDLARDLEAAGPWGAGASAPRFALPGLRLVGLRRAGEAHLLFAAADGSGARIEAAAFRVLGTPLGDFLRAAAGPVHLAGRIEAESRGGRVRVRLLVEDAAPAA